MATQYDAIIIGAGQAGNPLSTTLANAGWKTALIEREYVGGTCVNRGCTPTKTMIASARMMYLAKRAADYGIKGRRGKIDLKKVRQRKRDIVESFRNGSQQRIENTEGVDLLMGEAHFIAPKTIEAHLNTGETRQLTADKIFINTGGRPKIPTIEGLDSVPFLDSTSIMELDTIPENLLILGGGYIGVEFGQMFCRFGSWVGIVHRGRHLLSREDPDVAFEITHILREDGIEVFTKANPLRVEQAPDGKIHLTIQGPPGEHTLEGSHLLVSAGRTPNTDSLNLTAAGVETDKRGFVKVNERLETNVPGIYALGDVKGGPAFTHISYDDFRVIRTNLLEGGNTTISDRLVPYTLFTDPQLGRVGLSARQALKKGYKIRVARIPMTYVARALEVDETRGFMKAVIDADTNQILGCAILGIEGGEVMSILQVAMMGKLPYTTIREAVFAHPTLAEALNTLFMYVGDEIKSDA
jgi:pyruvate/2-oxoglutarate dehydrogenase complex dihydrolipoamide dehydrogenase (E3) component